MDRGTRRYHAKRVQARKYRRLWNDGGWMWRYPSAHRHLWWPMHKLTMNGNPKWWDTLQHIRPARIRSNQLEHLIERGIEAELLEFPDYRKPEIYYW